MGAAASAEEEMNGMRVLQSSSKNVWRSRKSSVLAKWQKREQQSQVFGVVRHAERADSVYGIYQGTRWTQTEDFLKYPMDPPLSDVGLEAAFEETAQRIAKFAVENNARIPIVVTSPYFRCVQTAAQVCRALGPDVRLLIDNSLGEVYGPAVMGEREPISPTRPMDQIVQWCRSRGVKCMSKTIGKWPEWPEDLQAARRRYADRFLTFLQRSIVAKRNFVLVTHGDCVGATVTMMPSQGGSKLEKVEYGGMFLGKRKDQRSKDKVDGATSGRRSPSSPPLDSRMKGILPCETLHSDDEPDEEAEAIDNPRFWKEVSRLDKPLEGGWMQSSAPPGTVREFLPPEPPKASDGWQVETYDLVLRSKSRPTTATEVFTKKMSSLVKNSKFSREQIERLLGELSDKPLGDTDESINTLAMQARTRVDTTGRTSTNVSTLLFGASEFGTHSEIGDNYGDEGTVITSSSIGHGDTSVTTESLEHYIGVLKGGSRRRHVRPKTQSSQPKTPKRPMMARTDEEGLTFNAPASDDGLRGLTGSNTDELVAGALMCYFDGDQEADSSKPDGWSRARASASGILSKQNAPKSPRSPVDPQPLSGSFSSQEMTGLNEVGEDAPWTPTKRPGNVDYSRMASQISGGRGSSEALSRLDSRGSSGSFGRSSGKVVMVQQQAMQLPGAALGGHSAAKGLGGSDSSPRTLRAPLLDGLQNSALMKRRGGDPKAVAIVEDPSRKSGKLTASDVEAVTSPSQQQPSQEAVKPAIALGGLQNSLLMRRRGPSANAAGEQPSAALVVSSVTSSSSSSLSPGSPPRVVAAPPLDTAAPAAAPRAGAESGVLFGGLQNSKLMKRRSSDEVSPPEPGSATLQVPGQQKRVPPQSSPQAVPSSGLQNSKLMQRRAAGQQPEDAAPSTSAASGTANPVSEVVAPAAESKPTQAPNDSSAGGGGGIQFNSLNNSKLMKRRSLDTSALQITTSQEANRQPIAVVELDDAARGTPLRGASATGGNPNEAPAVATPTACTGDDGDALPVGGTAAKAAGAVVR
eukprot:CAMPEP_0176176672 /NCGR_PEP_ID=MMETSP0120_2-20121206/90492_1 /TAXON_ID=160619 /ORGANISM="Kryptoperidinium foliaceum, Strain CCMP 1326" /LENGTH=1030 /DNA_ID=CAMNT_0017514717 /DNA_START=86 /DNA_END=3175 /DNA_ORIENTATION=+